MMHVAKKCLDRIVPQDDQLATKCHPTNRRISRARYPASKACGSLGAVEQIHAADNHAQHTANKKRAHQNNPAVNAIVDCHNKNGHN